MNDRDRPAPLGFQAKHDPMAEGIAIADAIVRRYGKRANVAPPDGHESATATPTAPPNTPAHED